MTLILDCYMSSQQTLSKQDSAVEGIDSLAPSSGVDDC